MTIREAIIILKNLKKCYSMDYFDIEDNNAIDMAILALEEIEQELNIIDEINKLRKVCKKYIKGDEE